MSDSPLGAVHDYLTAFNAGDIDAMTAAFVGPTAVADWYRDVMAESAHLGAANYHVTLGEPLHNDEKGDSAYVVAPATMTFDLNGTTTTQTGSVFTLALRKVTDGWRVAAWAWAKGAPR